MKTPYIPFKEILEDCSLIYGILATIGIHILIIVNAAEHGEDFSSTSSIVGITLMLVFVAHMVIGMLSILKGRIESRESQ